MSLSISMAEHRDGVVITNGFLTARIIPFGASLADLRLTGHHSPLVLGYESEGAYKEHGQYFGAIIGRYANRIANGHCVVDGTVLSLDRNDGPHHLHGGYSGFATREWTVLSLAPDSVKLGLVEPHGTAGYPGELKATVVYSLDQRTTLRLQLSAQCDRTTPINMCHHPYFNFAGDGSIDEHVLTIHSDWYLPAEPDLIPSGKIASVDGTVFDFRKPRTVQQSLRAHRQYNNTFCRDGSISGFWHAATLSYGGVSMDLHTDHPGVHFYNGYKILDVGRGLDGRRYHSHSGICLEAQSWPDSPNRDHFPATVLRPSENYKRHIQYKFGLEQ